MTQFKRMLEYLADGEFHSGEEIGKALGVTRAAVWKFMRQVREAGFEVLAVPKKGYSLKTPLALLSKDKITQNLQKCIRDQFRLIEVFDQLDSTNTYLLQRIYEYSRMPRICLAEAQTAGRGRLGRQWHSPFAQNIYLSILWRFEPSVVDFQGLSLVVGLAIANVLNHLGLPKAVKLKWPNDVLIEGQKLSGILVETRGEMHDGAQVVIGVGLNVNMKKLQSKINQQWISLVQLLDEPIDRNQLVSKLITEVVRNLEKFAASGFKSFRAAWLRQDALIGKKISLNCHGKTIKGEACGVDNKGRLLISSQNKNLIAVSVGEVSC